MAGWSSGASRESLSWRLSRLIWFERPFWASPNSVTWSRRCSATSATATRTVYI